MAAASKDAAKAEDALKARLQAEVEKCRKFEREAGVQTRKVTSLTHENETLLAETRTLAAQKDRAVELARLLQEENRRIKEQSEAAQKEVLAVTERTMENVNAKIETFMGEQKKVITENETLKERLAATEKALELMQAQQAAALKASSLEKQLAQAEKAATEKVCEELRKLAELAIAKEADAQAQVAAMKEKMGEVQETLTTAATMMTTMKNDHAKAQASVKAAEGERAAALKRAVKAESDLSSMLPQVQEVLTQLKREKEKGERLAGLCRALQQERRALLASVAAIRGALAEAAVPALEATVAALPSEAGVETGTGTGTGALCSSALARCREALVSMESLQAATSAVASSLQGIQSTPAAAITSGSGTDAGAAAASAATSTGTGSTATGEAAGAAEATLGSTSGSAAADGPSETASGDTASGSAVSGGAEEQTAEQATASADLVAGAGLSSSTVAAEGHEGTGT